MRSKLLCAALCAAMLLCGCGSSGSPAVTEEVTTVVTDPAPYQAVVEPDFRNILWGMRADEIYAQEKYGELKYYSDIYDYCGANGLESPDIDLFNTNNGCPVLEYDNISAVGFGCRVFYYLGDQGACLSAEYVIPPEEKEKHGEGAMDTINTYFDEMYCTSEMSPVPGYIYRRTLTSEIFIGELPDGSVHIFFRRAQDAAETAQTSRVIDFDNGTTVIKY